MRSQVIPMFRQYLGDLTLRLIKMPTCGGLLETASYRNQYGAALWIDFLDVWDALGSNPRVATMSVAFITDTERGGGDSSLLARGLLVWVLRWTFD